MQVEVRQIAIVLTRDEGVVLRSQITSLLMEAKGGTMPLFNDPALMNTPLRKLYDLLGGNFEASHKGVHFA